MVVCLVHVVQMMPLRLTLVCLRKIQIGFVFMVPVYPDSRGQMAIKWVLFVF